MPSDEHTAHVYQFLRNWAIVIAGIVGGLVIIAMALVVVGWPIIVAAHLGYSDTDILQFETIWSYVTFGWAFLIVTTGTAFMVTMDQVRRDD